MKVLKPKATLGGAMTGLFAFFTLFAIWAFFTVPMLVHFFHVIVDFWF